MKSLLFLLPTLCISLAVAAAEPDRPADKIDLSHWKLTLPVDSSGTTEGKATEIQAAELSTGYTHADYFHTDENGALVFWCPVNGARTKNTDYPRTELRELLDPDDNNVCWPATGTHILDARCRVTEVPSSQKVIIGQIHGFSGKAKPLIKLQFYKGKVVGLVKISPNEGKDLKMEFPEVGLDTDFDYQIKLADGILSVTVNGTTLSENVFEHDPEWANQTLYFKVGAYVQDNEGPATEGARVLISNLKVSHSE